MNLKLDMGALFDHEILGRITVGIGGQLRALAFNKGGELPLYQHILPPNKEQSAHSNNGSQSRNAEVNPKQRVRRQEMGESVYRLDRLRHSIIVCSLFLFAGYLVLLPLAK